MKHAALETHPTLTPVRICVALDDAAALEEAIGLALSTWTDQLTRGDRIAWQQYAASAHAIRNAFARSQRAAECRWIALRDDTPTVLHGVGRTCEALGDAGATLAAVARRYADCAAARAPLCEVAVEIPWQ
jgi:hypothetical protein